jgi:uncharacterized SAM-binding protein YcdF (DUF218 family)
MNIINDITEFIFVSNEPKKSNIIFVPGGSFQELPEKAAELYINGYAPLIMPSGKFSVKNGCFIGTKSKKDIYNGNYITECEFYSDVLIKNGVPDSAIIKEDNSLDTRSNAFYSHRVADDMKLEIKNAILCCKSFHTRRCLMLYQLAFPEAEISVVPVDCHGITRDNWYKQEYGIDRVLGELARCGNQFTDEIKEYLNIKAKNK